MKKEIVQFSRKLTRSLQKNSPVILTGIGVVGFVTTVGFAIKATPKAIQLIEEEKRELTKKEVIQTTWKCYIPTVAMGAVSITCIIGAHHIQQKRHAALAGLYSITEKSLAKYQEKVVEVIGENKAQKIKDEVNQSVINENPVKDAQIIFTGQGEMLCYDSLSGRYFKSDIEQIRRIENDLNHTILTQMSVSLNAFYYAIGLNGIDIGDMMGWNLDNMLKIEYSTMLSEDNKPCLVLDHYNKPKYNYE